MDSNNYLFTLPNGTHLSYAYPKDLKCGGQFKWYRSYNCFKITQINPIKKNRAPRIGLWSARGSQKLICADFDHLPASYRTWDKFYQDVKRTYPNDFVFRSMSGKVKVFFLIELKTGYINTKTARYIIEQLVPKNWVKSCDISYLGLSVCYTTPDMVRKLCAWLKNSPNLRRVNLAPLFRKISDHNFDIHKGKLPKSLDKFIRGNKSKELFCRMLLRQRRMAMASGFDIPTTKFARELGVGQKTVHRWRQELIELNFITCIDETYKINKKAMTFKAIGLFKKIIKEIFTKTKTKILTSTVPDFPKKILDGDWHKEVWLHSKYYLHDPLGFINKVASLPHSDVKRRTKKALYAMISRLKYSDMPYTHLVN